MPPDAYFAATYADARAKFLTACLNAGATTWRYRHPETGPDGESLYTDAARLGAPDAERVVVVSSACHGVEGFCGSGVQVGLLSDPNAPRPPDGVAMILVHALNPYGFAWLRRVTHEGVDLNRNFVDHSVGDYPQNPGYDELADAIVPRSWDDPTLEKAQKRFETYMQTHGFEGLQAAVSMGQWTHPDGLFYGGTAPTWSRTTIEGLCSEHLKHARHAAFIDFHTGLGPYGYGEPICAQPPGTDHYDRARVWFGDKVTNPANGDSSSADTFGDMLNGLANFLPQTSCTSVVLEFGVEPVLDTLDALRAEAWLTNHGDPQSELGRAIKAQMRRTFYGDEPEWKGKIWSQGSERVAQALAGLSGL